MCHVAKYAAGLVLSCSTAHVGVSVKFIIWLAMLSWVLQRAFVFACKAVFHRLHLEVRFICEQQLVAEWSMKSINPSPLEVLYV